VVHDPARRPVPPPVRVVLGLLNVSDFLELDLDAVERVQRGTEADTHAEVIR
jgi:hypothetical protein